MREWYWNVIQTIKNHFSYNKVGIEVENEGIRLITEYEQNTIVKVNPGIRTNNTINVQAVFANTRKYIIKKAYTISSVRPDSPAALVGLQKGDVIIRINGNDTMNYSLQEVIHKFYGKDGERVTIEVDRLGRNIKAVFKLKSLKK